MGPSQALAWDHPARTRLHLESSPAAGRATGELPHSTSSLSAAELGASALAGSLPRGAGFLPALPARTCRHSCWLPNPLRSPSGTAGPSLPPSLPPAQAHPTRCTSLAPRHSQRQVKGSHSHLCLALHQPLQAPGAECPPLGKREGVEEGEQPCLCCSAGGAVLGDRAQARETLTAWRRLNSFSSGLIDGRRVTRAVFAPSGVLYSGKGQGESWVSPRLPLRSSQAALPESCPQAQGHLSPHWGAVIPHPAVPGASPRLTPAVCPPTAPSAPGSCRKRGERASGPAAPQPCPAGKDTGAGQSAVGQDRGAAQALAPSVLPEQLLLPFPSGDQKVTRGCRTWKCPYPSLPPCCPLPAQALHGGQGPFTGWPGHGWEPLLPCRGTWHHDAPPRRTQKWQHRSRWAR